MTADGFYWVLLGFNGFHWVLLSFYWISRNLSEYSWVSLGCIRFYSILLGFTEFLPVFVVFYLDLTEWNQLCGIALGVGREGICSFWRFNDGVTLAMWVHLGYVGGGDVIGTVVNGLWATSWWPRRFHGGPSTSSAGRPLGVVIRNWAWSVHAQKTRCHSDAASFVSCFLFFFFVFFLLFASGSFSFRILSFGLIHRLWLWDCAMARTEEEPNLALLNPFRSSKWVNSFCRIVIRSLFISLEVFLHSSWC